MSSPIANTPVATNSRKPTLQEKYGKFIQFAYYMMDNILGEEVQKETYLEKINLFGTVEEQQIMVQGFLDNAKENKTNMKKTIADHKKELINAEKAAAKALAKEQKANEKALAKVNKPAKQPRDEKVTPEVVVKTEDTNNEKKSTPVLIKRTRKPTAKKNVQNAEEEIINELVQNTVEEKPVVETKKTKKVTKKVSAVEPEMKPLTNELVAEEFITETPETVKPKRKVTKKTNKNETHATTDAGILPPTTTPETNIEITPITISDKTYFKDENSNIYSYPIPTSQPIGKYNADTNDITLD